jgi:hypothetical protein
MLFFHVLMMLLPNWWRCKVDVFFLTEPKRQTNYTRKNLKGAFFFLSYFPFAISWFRTYILCVWTTLDFMFLLGKDETMRFNNQWHTTNGGVRFEFRVVLWLRIINPQWTVTRSLESISLSCKYFKLSCMSPHLPSKCELKGFLKDVA